ncbi:MAG: DUF975 family protein [Gudongella sp.]|nr:DUF975 family protein [Gudongella sp.]
MWSRVELKTKAKAYLKKYYWKAFAVTFIVALMAGAKAEVSTNNNYFSPGFGQSEYYLSFNLSDWTTKVFKLIDINPFQVAVVGSVFFLFIIGIILFKIIVTNAMEVGAKRFFISDVYEEPEISTLFSTFKKGEWPSIAFNMFLMDLFIALWGLLLIVPGIIKYYEYCMVPYILAEEPQMSFDEAKTISASMTSGQKGKIFELDVSFIGWYLLGGLLFGLGGLFVRPYHEATLANLYKEYRNEMELPLREQFQ